MTWLGVLMAASLIASAFVSGHAWKSIFGQGFEISSASFIILLFLSVAVTAAATEGKANRALAEVLAHALGVRGSAVAVVGGEHSRDKTVRIEGLSAAEARRRIDELLGREDP